MKRIRFILLLVFIVCLPLAFTAFSEDCEHKWKYTNNGESSHTAVCSLCNQSRSDAHNLTSSRTKATCQAPATVKYECTLCSYLYTFTEGEKNPTHAWGEYEVVRRASCRQTGLNSRTCPDCGQVETLEVDTLAHDYGQWQQYDEKWHIRYCKHCQWAYKGSHRLNDGEITVQPTESQLGLVKYTCRVCNDTFENILRQDGAIYAMETKDVLGNGTGYLLAASKGEDDPTATTIGLSNGKIDLRPIDDSEASIYANAKTGNYAGISVESGETAIDVIGQIDHETVSLEFLHLMKNASVNLRLFNSSGAIEIQNLNGPRVIICQEKNSDGKIVTLLMRVDEKRDSVELEAEMHLSEAAGIVITNKSGEYKFTLPENAQKTASLTFKYQRKTGKITVNPRNHENTAAGTAISILEGTEILRTAENTKTAEAYVQLSDDTGAWRLRAGFPNGFTLETPLFQIDGAYISKPLRYLMDEEALAELMLIDPTPKAKEEETPDLQLPDESQTADQTQASSDTPKADEASILASDTYALNTNDVKAFACREYPAIVVQYAPGKFTVDQSGDTGGWEITSVTLVQKGSTFKILNAYQIPAEFNVSGSGTITIRAQLKNGAEAKEVTLGTYVLEP
ncbi:MAG: hypothetical protein E7322_03040 [Clostridiales bacterium]|nr:hypothetical protein [Clostridiales bacterium]